mgnify:FL=1|tara:strand:- start:13951 stop:15108 length:1158 start_codon:yes stop_codon:yes gene_type:complete
MSTIQLAPNNLAYKFESPGRYATHVNYLNGHNSYDIIEFNSYLDKPYHLNDSFKFVNLTKLKNPNTRVLISHIRERLNSDSSILRGQAVFIDWLVQSEVCKAEQILYIVGCQTEQDFLQEYTQACLKEHTFQHKIKILSYPHFETDAVWRMYQEGLSIANRNYDELKTFVKKDFLFLNAKIHKANRINLAVDLFQRGILDNGIYSLNTSHTSTELYPLVQHLIDQYSFGHFYSNIPHSPDNIEYDSESDHYLGYPFDYTLYEKTKYSLVAETHYENNPFLLTEKTARPILNKHPFVIASTVGFLKQLHEFGYHTFNELWPEEYDLETDTTKRLSLVADTVEYINNNTVDWIYAYQISKENYTTLQRRYDRSVRLLTECLSGSFRI